MKRFMFFALSSLAIGCGARTGLHEPPPEAGIVDAGQDASDAMPDVFDAAPDVHDAAPDVFDAAPDVHHVSCEEAGITYIYLISSQNKLLRFYPPSLKFKTIGTINCPSGFGDTPFSMAVDRAGIAYVQFSQGEIMRVSTLTASCQMTSFVPGQNGFPTNFGMGFSADQNDPGETLYVAGDNFGGSATALATIDVNTFNLSVVAPFTQPIGNPELTGTGDGRLFGFGPGSPNSHIAEIDKTTAQIKSDVLINLQQSNFSAWAFAFWGGDFYTFTASSQGGSSVVHRYTPGGTTTPPIVAKTSSTIVGAGVSTCAPSK